MNNLKHYRTKAGLSQAQLAERVSISARTLQDYEQNRRPLEKAAAITVLNMARCLGCTVENLIDGEILNGSEMIRCKNCEHYILENPPTNDPTECPGDCCVLGCDIWPDDFCCYYSKRKEATK